MILVWGLFSVPYLPRPKPLLWKSSARGPAWHSFSGAVVGRLGTPMFSRYQVEMASPERLDGSHGFSFLAFLVSRGWGSHRSNTVVERKGQARWVCKHLGEGGEREKLGEKIPQKQNCPSGWWGSGEGNSGLCLFSRRFQFSAAGEAIPDAP